MQVVQVRGDDVLLLVESASGRRVLREADDAGNESFYFRFRLLVFSIVFLWEQKIQTSFPWRNNGNMVESFLHPSSCV